MRRSHNFRDTTGINEIDADDIFYYVYGLLQSPDYKTRFAADLKKMLPRVPYAGRLTDFREFSEIGKQLAELHIAYEEVDLWPLTITDDRPNLDEKERYRVQKMRFGAVDKKSDTTVIQYNDFITVTGIPEKAYEYIVNGKSAIEWVMERYQVTQHKESGIKNNPNSWSDNPRYILELLQKVVTVSMKTQEIVSKLPDIDAPG